MALNNGRGDKNGVKIMEGVIKMALKGGIK
jgi:hypothetical protein